MINILSGASAGALVAAFYADGFTPEEILTVFSSKKIFNLMRITLPKTGFFKVDGLKSLLITTLRTKKIEQLKIPIVISATNFNEGKIEYFREGNLVEVLLASSGIPLLFEISKINNVPYIDGGIMDNLPVTPIRKDCRKVIAVHANPIGINDKSTNLAHVIERSFHLAIASEINNKKSLVDLFIEPVALKNYGILDIKNAKEIFDIGYKEGHRMLKAY